MIEPSGTPGQDPKSQEKHRIKLKKTRKTGHLPTTPTCGNVLFFLMQLSINLVP